MKRFEAQKAYLACLVILTVFITMLSACGGGGGGHWNAPVGDVTVTSTVPANGATAVFTNTKISATFSREMNPSSITTSTFIVKKGTIPVPGTVSYSGVTAVFTPIDPATNLQKNLDINTIYTATITTGAKDQSGRGLASE